MYAGVQLGEGAGGRGVFGLSAGARFAPPPLAYPVGGTEEGGPLIRRGSRRALGAAGSLREILGLCAGGGLVPPPVSGMLCGWYGEGGPLIRHGSRRHTFPLGGRLWGGWKPAGDFGPLRRGGACPRLSLACSVTGTGEEAPHPAAARAATPSPVGGRLLGRLEACGRFWASAQGRGLPRLSLACSVTGTGGGGPLIRHGSRRDTFPTGGRLLKAAGSRPHEVQLP